MTHIIMDKIIFLESDEAAKKITVEGWVSRNGRFYGDDEDMARYDGCTVNHCEKCGEPTKAKHYRLCDKCRIEKEKEDYLKREEVEWDGESPIYSETLDKYVFSEEDIEYILEEVGYEDLASVPQEELDKLRFLECEPIYFHEVYPIEYYSDILPIDGYDDDSYIPKEIEKAFEILNETIKNSKKISSWIPTKKRIKIK
jgi:hypothetical protein